MSLGAQHFPARFHVNRKSQKVHLVECRWQVIWPVHNFPQIPLQPTPMPLLSLFVRLRVLSTKFLRHSMCVQGSANYYPYFQSSSGYCTDPSATPNMTSLKTSQNGICPRLRTQMGFGAYVGQETRVAGRARGMLERAT